MKILVALHDYLPLHPGGSEIHAHQTAAELARRGHEVVAAFTERDLDRPQGEIRRGRLDGVRTIELVHQREYADVRESYRQERALEAFRGIVTEESPDVVHFHHLSLWGSGALGIAREAGARVVLTLHDFHLLCDEAVLLKRSGDLCTDGPRGTCTDCLRRHPVLPDRWGADGSTPGKDEVYARAARERLELHRRDLARVDVAISPSRFLAGLLCGAGLLDEGRVVVLKYGYPGERRPPRERPREPLRVGYVGGIYPSKGVHVLVEAFEHLGDVPAGLEVRGNADWFPAFAADLRARAGGLPIRFPGPFEPGELDAVLGGFDVLVVPSLWYENLPLTIQEAFRNGLPVVTTDLGGMAESVADGISGLTFPRGNARELASCLRRLVEEPDLYGKLAAGRPDVPTLGSVVDRLEELYVSPR